MYPRRNFAFGSGGCRNNRQWKNMLRCSDWSNHSCRQVGELELARSCPTHATKPLLASLYRAQMQAPVDLPCRWAVVDAPLLVLA